MATFFEMVVLPVPGSPPKIINILIPLILQIILILPMFDQYGPVLRYVRSAATMFKLENLLSDFHIHPDIHLRITLSKFQRLDVMMEHGMK